MNGAEFTISSSRVIADGTDAPGWLRVRDGRIADLIRPAPPEPLPAADIELRDLVLMPGVIDAHVHINEPGRTDWEGFRTAGRAAAAGGVTTMVVMPLNCEPVVTSAAALKLEADAAAGKCLIDYGFWGGVVPGNSAELRALWNAGVLGFKCFMVHSGIDEFPNATEYDLDEAMPILRELGAVLLAHAEDPTTIDAARQPSGLDRNPTSYAAYLRSRPPESETIAIKRLISLAHRHAGIRLHVVHVSAAESLPIIAAAKREGLHLSAETCPHYLVLAAEKIADGATPFKCAPPIRGERNRELLWRAIADGTLDLIASDHSPCPPELKRLAEGSFAAAWGGISSLQLTLSVLGLDANRHDLTLPLLVERLSHAPAKLAGIDAFKGRIAPGFDADLVVHNPDVEWTIEAAKLHHRHKLTPYDGMSVRGAIKATFVRGRIVYAAADWPHERASTLGSDGLSTEALGQWIKRTRP